MKRKVKATKILSFVLAIVLSTLTFPLIVFAEEPNTDLLIEIESLREETAKHFLNPDGTYTLVGYNAPVHRKDANGKWQDINNIVNEKAKNNRQVYVTEDGRTEFFKKITSSSNEIFTLKENGYEMKVSILHSELKNSTAKVSNHSKKYIPTLKDDIETQKKKVKEIDTNTTIRYKNILNGIDLEYVLSANDIKENIIVNKLQSNYEYSFAYELSGLVVELDENGNILFLDNQTNDIIYWIPAPYMYDSNGAKSYEASYKVKEIEACKYEITLCADSDWINSNERKLPVTIDPGITSYGTEKDTFIDHINTTTNFGSATGIIVGQYYTGYIYRRLAPLPDEATITQANLNLYYFYFITGGSLDIRVNHLIAPWEENTLTYEIADAIPYLGVYPYGGSTATLVASPTITDATPALVSVDVTELYKEIYAGMPFYGFGIEYDSGVNTSVIIKSREGGDSVRAQYQILYERNAPLPEDATYYVENAEYHGAYMQPDNNGKGFVELWDFDAQSYQRWYFEYLHNGYYKIVCEDGNLALSVPSGESDNESEKLEVDDYSYSSKRDQWKITDIGGGKFTISPRSNESFNMSAGAGILTSNGRNVEQRNPRSDEMDEWYLRKPTYAYSIGGEFIGGQDVISASNSWLDCGYVSSYDINPNINSLNLKNLNSSVVYFSSHGSQHRLALPNDIYLCDDYYTNASNNVIVNNYTLSKAKLYIYDACKTASNEDGSGENLCTNTLDAGVDCVIGWAASIQQVDSIVWQRRFQDALIDGSSVIDAANHANSFLYIDNSAIKSWIIYGNQNLKISQEYAEDAVALATIAEPTNNILFDDENLCELLKNNFDNYKDAPHFVEKTYTNEEKTNFVIDYVYLNDVFFTNSGYSIIVENGMIIQMKDNVLAFETNKNVPTVTDQIINMAYAQSTAEMEQLNFEYKVLEQEGKKWYDIENDRYFYVVKTTYETPELLTGTKVTFFDLEISNETNCN